MRKHKRVPFVPPTSSSMLRQTLKPNANSPANANKARATLHLPGTDAISVAAAGARRGTFLDKMSSSHIGSSIAAFFGRGRNSGNGNAASSSQPASPHSVDEEHDDNRSSHSDDIAISVARRPSVTMQHGAVQQRTFIESSFLSSLYTISFRCPYTFFVFSIRFVTVAGRSLIAQKGIKNSPSQAFNQALDDLLSSQAGGGADGTANGHNRKDSVARAIAQYRNGAGDDAGALNEEQCVSLRPDLRTWAGATDAKRAAPPQGWAQSKLHGQVFALKADDWRPRHALKVLSASLRTPAFHGVVVSVACGVGHCGAITRDGQLFMWGLNDDGQLGVGNKGRQAAGAGPNTMSEADVFSRAYFETPVHVPLKLKRSADSSGAAAPASRAGAGAVVNNTLAAKATNEFASLRVKRTVDRAVSSMTPSPTHGNHMPTPPPPKASSPSNAAAAKAAPTGLNAAKHRSLNGPLKLSVGADGKLVNPNAPVVAAGDTRDSSSDASQDTANWEEQKVVAIALGPAHSLAVTESGHVFAWGAGMHGVLGLGSDADKYTPTVLEGFGHPGPAKAGGAATYLHVRQVACSQYNSACVAERRPVTSTAAVSTGKAPGKASVAANITKDSDSKTHYPTELYVWGAGVNGQYGLGDEQLAPSLTPQLVALPLPPMDSVVAVALGARHVMALTALGAVYTWGDNEFGQCGRVGSPEESKRSMRPATVLLPGATTSTPSTTAAGPTRAVHIACGERHCSLVTADGRVISWGSNETQQLGCEENALPPNGDAFSPVTAAFGSSGLVISRICIGQGITSAVTSDGRVYAWGFGVDSGTPKAMSELDNEWVQDAVVGSAENVLALTGSPQVGGVAATSDVAI